MQCQMNGAFHLLLLCIKAALASSSSLEGSVTDYAPTMDSECPDISVSPLIRTFTPENQSLHPFEENYIRTRSEVNLPNAWEDWLGDGSQLGYNLTVVKSSFPRIGIAVPGGGLRAALYGAGSLSALDARNPIANQAGTGGLLQVSSYISGLSGGSWLIGSLFLNNWPSIKELVLGNDQDLDGWLLDLPLVMPDGNNILSEKNQAYYGSILWSVMSKELHGIDTSITDLWSRMISYHFLNQTSRDNFFSNESAHGAGQLWSDIQFVPAFQRHQTPFPVVVANSRPIGSNSIGRLPLEPIVYEITPYELASFDPQLSAGVNLSYSGTQLVDGNPLNISTCVTGFDQAGFIMGTSASLFNQIFDFARNQISQFSKADSSALLHIWSRQLEMTRGHADDVANWPNPFYALKNKNFHDRNSTLLELIDGSSNQENIPLAPLLVKVRGLDVIVILEGSADDPVNNWPNGTGLIFTARRQQLLLQASHQRLPPIPDSAQTFFETGINARPTFFGCDPVESPAEYPLVIYLPNAPPFNGSDPVTNTATFTLQYSAKHVGLFLEQVFANIVSGFVPETNLPDLDWNLCLKCAAIDRMRMSSWMNMTRSSSCIQCFNRYCYDPNNLPSRSQLPNRKLEFGNPDFTGIDKLGGFLSANKFYLLAAMIGCAATIAIITYILYKFKNHFHKGSYQKI
ncbi:hypothetical protein AMATHDRAFT_67917 [Amanita thiersii Skay4041]|uniref:Lysophospholipase n=1 Tax=Amanita thiersii Skay4041 TaxID=703135 RepID=A0A2A9NDF2_9AGAR|nr:hypothetical protein AMATHDRAFT_67917 [Amanita thiersii Skay4041]